MTYEYKPTKTSETAIGKIYQMRMEGRKDPAFLLNKEVKKDKNKLFLEDIKNKDTITEKEVLLIKRRLNDKTYNIQEVNDALGDEGKALTPEQNEKGKAWLMNKWKSPTGKIRQNSPYGYREEQILENFKEIRLKDWYDDSNYYQSQSGIKNYQPYYEVIGNETSFEYVVAGGELKILG